MKKKRRKKRRSSGRSPHAEATYVCDSCGEEIVVPVDILLTAVENGGAGRSKMVALGCVDLP